ncbi:hypothetical protein ACFQ7Z_16775 [Streptomyces virginiae]|uniref:hypothetical protein n=1 Tax=Streptomyces virginiae TaxID=1961 RepID=UPI0036C08918
MVPDKKLIVIGAGPKGIALAAKAAVLRELQLGEAVPKVSLIEKGRAGAYWSGEHGYTDGSHALATSPLKDLGFPYRSTAWGSNSANVNRAMLKYSWQAFLVDDSGHRTHRFADWVDRGLPEPRLSVWSEYLHWAAEEIKEQIAAEFIIRGEVTHIEVLDDTWQVSVGDEKHSCNGLVVTGPGAARMPKLQDGWPGVVTDAQNFWRGNAVRHQLREDMKRSGGIIGVIGDGGASASTILSLLSEFPKCQIKVFAPWGVLYSRGESFDENRHHSNPADWVRLEDGSRKRFLRHTSNGVFSLLAKRGINQAENLTTIAGEVNEILIDDGVPCVRVVDPETKQERVIERVDFAVVAMGFDDMWWISLLGNGARQKIQNAIAPADAKPVDPNPEATPQSLGACIGEHLELKGMHPYLHLPMLAAYEQGPGFPSLGCLGLLSDRILDAYCGEQSASRLGFTT